MYLPAPAHSTDSRRATRLGLVALIVALIASALVPLAVATPAAAASDCWGIPATIVGTPGNDLIIGTPGRDIINAGRGADEIYGLEGNDVICGGRGPDIIHGGPGNDSIRGGNAADQLFGNRGNDDLRGNVGQDLLNGGPGADHCEGANELKRCEPAVAGREPAQCSHALDDNLVPRCGARLGTTSRVVDLLDLATQEERLDRRFDLVRRYKVGPDDEFFTAEEQRWGAEGRTLVVSWKISTSNVGQPVWARVAAGDYDDAIRQAANDIRDSGLTVMFSLHHEPEDNVGTAGTAADYVAMFRRVHAIMEPIAADQLVWFINYRGWSTGVQPLVEQMYPGDDVIDWISFNPYNWFGCRKDAQWLSFADQARPFYEWVAQAHPDKPLMIGETATNEFPGQPDRKAQWIADMAESLQTEFTRIRAVVWFHQSTATGFCDRRWDSSLPSGVATWAVGLQPYFNGSV